jgi:hypothetical protein
LAAQPLPYLIVGDVHGDLMRLFEALKPYPATEWRTIFLGDLVDYGDFGVGALRYARDRPNSTTLLGNHEVAMLHALRDRAMVSSWLAIGGQAHDLEELRRDELLQDWVRNRPAMVRLDDGTLAQHCGHDGYRKLIEREGDTVDAINARVRALLDSNGELVLWDVLSPKNIFPDQPDRLDRWLELTGCNRVVHGHTPHGQSHPAASHGGRAINYDGYLSRSHRHFRAATSVRASVAPLPATL